MRRLAWLPAVFLVGACGATEPAAGDLDPEPETIVDLPVPSLAGDHSLEEVIAQRRSVREYTDVPLTIDEVSRLLWATQGVTSDSGRRAAPSAGALYPLEMYLVDATGVHHYVPEGHRLEGHAPGDLRADLGAAALDQSAVADAPAVFVITGVMARTEAKYGDRAERYVILEAGHAAQNLLLQAVALDLAAVPIGAFDDADVQRVLALPSDHEPLYLIPVGRPG
jgi:SagB-type dehydrogenase family enzyme